LIYVKRWSIDEKKVENDEKKVGKDL